MKHTLRIILGGLVAVAFTVCAQAAELAAGAISVNQVYRDVTCKFPGSEEFVPVVNGKLLPQGSIIKTGDESTVNLEFSSGATAMVRPNSEIEVTKFEQELVSGKNEFGNEEPSLSKTNLKLMTGSRSAPSMSSTLPSARPVCAAPSSVFPITPPRRSLRYPLC
jgi:hypothetical protein